MTIVVCTYNSASTIERCLSSIAGVCSQLIVIDHESIDGTAEIAKQFGANVHAERVGLGFARQMAFEIVQTDFLAFVDSDVEVTEPAFFSCAVDQLEDERMGAVVGLAQGHRLVYGLPAGLLMLRSRDFKGKVIPPRIDARETYYIQHRLNLLGLKTVYLANAMVHDSKFRRFKPEWEGANTRLISGVSANQLLFAFGVIVLLSLNSRNLKNMMYIPIFCLKFLRGFAEPQRWRRLERSVASFG